MASEDGPVGALESSPIAQGLPAPLNEETALALEEAAGQGVTGAALTPFLLTRLAEISKGETLAANVALLKDNARLAAEIAAALAELKAG